MDRAQRDRETAAQAQLGSGWLGRRRRPTQRALEVAQRLAVREAAERARAGELEVATRARAVATRVEVLRQLAAHGVGIRLEAALHPLSDPLVDVASRGGADLVVEHAPVERVAERVARSHGPVGPSRGAERPHELVRLRQTRAGRLDLRGLDAQRGGDGAGVELQPRDARAAQRGLRRRAQ